MPFIFKLILAIFVEVFFFRKIFSFDNTDFFYAFEKHFIRSTHVETEIVLLRPYTHFNANQTSSSIIIRTPPPSPPFKRVGKVNFNDLLRRGGGWLWKIENREWKYDAGAGLLNRGGWHFSYLIFSSFIIFTGRNYFTLCKIVLCIWRKFFFSATIILWKKFIRSYLKMNLKISNKLR